MTEEDRTSLREHGARLDAATWFGLAMQRVQELEATIVAYATLVMDHEPENAAREAAGVFEVDGLGARALAAAIAPTSSSRAELHARLVEITREREWLIHKGGLIVLSQAAAPSALAEVVPRVAKLADAAAQLAAGVRERLEAHLATRGISAEEARQRTEAVIGRWLAA